jgi:hypothetical protein
MTPFRNSLKTPEEIELHKKREELAGLRVQCDACESDFMALKSEIRMFERVYEEILGSRISRLEDLEWQLNGLLENSEAVELTNSPPNMDAFAYFHHRTDLLDDEEDVAPNTPRKSLKSIYRDVAKAIHPDLAPDEGERLRRQDLMAVANHAYEVGDRKALEDILADWEPGPLMATEMDVAMELVRVIREIARVQQNIHALGRQIDELRATDIYHFKVRVDESLADGVDLLAEMVAAIDLDISRSMNRLAVLRGEASGASDRHGTPLETRIISFTTEKSCGTLYDRSRGSLDYRDWKRFGDARGAREVFLDKSVRLDVKGPPGHDFSFLDSLQPDDLQAIFFYDVHDEALHRIRHLTGLEELYLSNTQISDQGLGLLGDLRGLQRLYIYHTPVTDFGLMNLVRIPHLKWLTCSGTSVTEEGLERLRIAIPGCKAVSFKWRYDQ